MQLNLSAQQIDMSKEQDNTFDNKQPWTPKEDLVLVQLVEKVGPQKWTMISEYLPQRLGK